MSPDKPLAQAPAASPLQPLFIPAGTPPGPLARLALADAAPSKLRQAIAGLPFNTVYDYIRSGARAMADAGNHAKAIRIIADFDELLTRAADLNGDRATLDIHAALEQVRAGLLAASGDTDAALSAAGSALSILAAEPRRKDEPFLAVLASLLYDLALIHDSRAEYPRAERSLDKAARIFQRLARINPDRYAPAHIVVLDAASKVGHRADHQAEALKQCQEATARYLALCRNGAMDETLDHLVNSLAEQGVTLARMGRHREAVQYLSRALRYLTRLNPETDMRQLELSTELGIALLLHKPSREKGIHLLNTMLHKATRLGANDLHRRIVGVLADARTPARFDILSVWHKVFPR